MRKQKSGGTETILAPAESAPNAVLLPGAPHQNEACSGLEAPEMALAPMETGGSKGVISANPTGARPLFREQGIENGSKTREQEAFLCGALGSKTPPAAKPAAVAQYLSGFPCSDGSLSLIQRYYFRNTPHWAQRRAAELEEKCIKARRYFDETTPDWSDAVPTGDEQAKGWRLVFKNMAQLLELELLKDGFYWGLDPTAGYKGMRCYIPALDATSEALVSQLLRDVAWQQRIGAPGRWHGPNIVQLAEADFCVVAK